jgi:arsenate reductase
LAQALRESGVEYERINYFTEELTEEKIRDLVKKLALAPFELLRKNEAIFKELNLTRETDAGEIIRQIARHPNLLQRPIVELGDRAVVARPVEKALDLINAK